LLSALLLGQRPVQREELVVLVLTHRYRCLSRPAAVRGDPFGVPKRRIWQRQVEDRDSLPVFPRTQIATMPDSVRSIFLTVTVTPKTVVSIGVARFSSSRTANPASSSSSW
jgi:hypothetical protein